MKITIQIDLETLNWVVLIITLALSATRCRSIQKVTYQAAAIRRPVPCPG